MSTRSIDLERLPLRSDEVEVPAPSLFLPDIDPTIPHAIMSSPSTGDNSAENSDSSSESSESSTDSEEEWEHNGAKGENGTRQLRKRKKSQPLKFTEEFPAKRKRTRQKKEKPILSKSSPFDPNVRRRGKSCGTCDGCQREDCAKCQFCLDKPKFGGPGKKKQRCEKRPCANFQKKGTSTNLQLRTHMKLKIQAEGASAEKESKKEPQSEPPVHGTSSGAEIPLVAATSTVPATPTVAMTSEVAATSSSTSAFTATGTPQVETIPVSTSISSSMLTPIAHAMTTPPVKMTAPPVKSLATVVEMLTGAKNPVESTAASVPAVSSLPVLMTATPPVLSSMLTDRETQDKVNSVRQGIAYNQFNIAEVSKRVAVTRKLIQDTLNSNLTPPTDKTGFTISSSPPGVLTKSPMVVVTPFKPTDVTAVPVGPNPSIEEPLLPARTVPLASATPIQQSTSSPVLSLSASKGICTKAPGSSLKPQPKLLKTKDSPSRPSIEGLKKILATMEAATSKQDLKNNSQDSPPASQQMKVPDMKKGQTQGSTPNPYPKGLKAAAENSSVKLTPKNQDSTDPKLVKTPAQDAPSDPRLAARKVVVPDLKQANGPAQGSPSDPRLAKKVPVSDPKVMKAQAQDSVAKPVWVVKKLPADFKGVKKGVAQASPTKPARKGPAQDSHPKTASTPKEATKALGSPLRRELRKSSAQSPVSPRAGPSMKCIQCGRDRSVALARSTKFCTQRCTVLWVEDNPNEVPHDAVDIVVAACASPKAPPTPTKAQDSSKALPRALKNLQIDMAKPGTKLELLSESSNSSTSSTSDADEREAKLTQPLVTSDPSVNSLSSLIAQQQKNIVANAAQQQKNIVANAASAVPAVADTGAKSNDDRSVVLQVVSKPLVLDQPKASSSGAEEFKVPAKGAVKRSTTATHGTAVKKPKVSAKSSAQSSQKSVSFYLSGQPEIASTPPPTTSIPVLDKIASYLMPKKGGEIAKIPPGLPSDVRQWSVSQVVDYFKSTSDCKSYVELFESQEVDGIALLLLSHETLVKCLGIKLGRAVKIMNRVQELKAYQEHHSSTNKINR